MIVCLPLLVDRFDGRNRQNRDFSVRILLVSSLFLLNEPFRHMMTIMMIYDTVIMISGIR
jgi:hypothetical protein